MSAAGLVSALRPEVLWLRRLMRAAAFLLSLRPAGLHQLGLRPIFHGGGQTIEKD